MGQLVRITLPGPIRRIFGSRRRSRPAGPPPAYRTVHYEACLPLVAAAVEPVQTGITGNGQFSADERHGVNADRLLREIGEQDHFAAEAQRRRGLRSC